MWLINWFSHCWLTSFNRRTWCPIFICKISLIRFFLDDIWFCVNFFCLFGLRRVLGALPHCFYSGYQHSIIRLLLLHDFLLLLLFLRFIFSLFYICFIRDQLLELLNCGVYHLFASRLCLRLLKLRTSTLSCLFEHSLEDHHLCWDFFDIQLSLISVFSLYRFVNLLLNFQEKWSDVSHSLALLIQLLR